MPDENRLIFKIASEPWEFEQIHQLNYETFVEEIPQHQQNKTRTLIDKYHAENTYVICTCAGELLGMIALRDQRPLSLDQKLDRLESYLPPFKRILEYRLLAIRQGRRNSAVFSGIMKLAFDKAIEGVYDIAVISGTTRQFRLYRHLGFKPFGPLVGEAPAQFQPMYIDFESAMALKRQSAILNSY